MKRSCAWPTLYLEINGNDDDSNKITERLDNNLIILDILLKVF